MGESVGGVGSWEDDDEELLLLQTLGAFPVPVKIVEDAAEETLLLWTFQQPTKAAQNAYVQQRSLHLRLDACGHSLDIMQTPSSMVCSFSSQSKLAIHQLCCVFVCFPADCVRILPSLFWFWKSGLEPLHAFSQVQKKLVELDCGSFQAQKLILFCTSVVVVSDWHS